MMSQQQRLIYLPLVGTILVCVLIGVYLVAWKRFSKPTPPKVTKHKVETSPDDALAYWTAERMRQAKPAPMPQVNVPEQGKRPLNTSDPRQV